MTLKRKDSCKTDKEKMVLAAETEEGEPVGEPSSISEPSTSASGQADNPDMATAGQENHLPEPLTGDSVKPSEPQAPDPAMLPLSLRRIHSKLQNETELLKLHLKHFHMSLEQFKRRTSALNLPDSVYAKYELVVKKCEACMESRPPPPRSRISGLRAVNFGDLVFIDHGSVKLCTSGGEKEYMFFAIMDGATNLLWAVLTNGKEESEAQEVLREWMDHHQCRPKALVGDQAFMTPSWTKFYAHYGIRPISLGPRTPWPNRAETAIRLFKRQLYILSRDSLDDPTLKSLKNTKAKHLVRKAVWARNTQLTFSGKSPIELAYGRRPPDLIQTENCDPAQLSEEPLGEELRDQVLSRLAIKAHLEAQQILDLRKDLARKLRTSEGPFKADEKVFYWDQDHSKIKSGKWVRGKVISHSGPMVAIDTGRTVVRVNETKIRRDHDPWHDIVIPVSDPDEKTLEQFAKET